VTQRISRLEPEFVEFMPKELQSGKLYVSMIYATTQHLCACGCGVKVVLPLSPAEWNLRFDGESVSISPSVGNWEYSCRSHYWIEKNRVRWAGTWTETQIEAGRKRDQADLETLFAERRIPSEVSKDSAVVKESKVRRVLAALRRLIESIQANRRRRKG
jgi:hypothetical protein